MYVCRLHRFVLPRFFCLYWLPMYVDPAVFFVLRSYIYKILYVLMYLDYWFLFLTIFMLVLNSHVCEIVRFFVCTEFLRSKVKHFIPIKNKMIRWPLKRPRRSYKILYVLMYLDYWFLFPTIFMLLLNTSSSESLSLNNEVNICLFVCLSVCPPTNNHENSI